MHTCNKKPQQSCDFFAIEIHESFSKKCDVVLKKNDTIKTNVFAESWEKITIGRKKGAKTDVTKGIMLSPEWCKKVMHDDNCQCLFFSSSRQTDIFLKKATDGR